MKKSQLTEIKKLRTKNCIQLFRNSTFNPIAHLSVKT